MQVKKNFLVRQWINFFNENTEVLLVTGIANPRSLKHICVPHNNHQKPRSINDEKRSP